MAAGEGGPVSVAGQKSSPRPPTGELRFRSVIDFVGLVNDAIQAKVIPQPELMDFNGWKSWQAGPGKRPTVSRRVRGTGIFTTPKEIA